MTTLGDLLLSTYLKDLMVVRLQRVQRLENLQHQVLLIVHHGSGSVHRSIVLNACSSGHLNTTIQESQEPVKYGAKIWRGKIRKYNALMSITITMTGTGSFVLQSLSTWMQNVLPLDKFHFNLMVDSIKRTHVV